MVGRFAGRSRRAPTTAGGPRRPATSAEPLEKAGLKPDKHVAKQVEASSKDVDAAVADTAKQLG